MYKIPQSIKQKMPLLVKGVGSAPSWAGEAAEKAWVIGGLKWFYFNMEPRLKQKRWAHRWSMKPFTFYIRTTTARPTFPRNSTAVYTQIKSSQFCRTAADFSDVAAGLGTCRSTRCLTYGTARLPFSSQPLAVCWLASWQVSLS